MEPPRGLAVDADPWRAVGLSRSGLTRFLRAAQEAVGLRGPVDVLLADDRMLRRLNREFRAKDKATDVLSFPAAEELRGEHAGDVAISLETAARQAKEHGHGLRDEVRVLLLHGLLHLQGMDHETDRGEMARREAELRVRLGLPHGLIARMERKGFNAEGAKKGRGGRYGFGAGAEKSRFPSEMTERKATTKAKAKATATAHARVKRGGR